MTTPLQQAAQAVIKQCEADALWANYPWVGNKLDELRKALDAELQQSVEPFAYINKNGIVLTPCDTEPDDEPLYLRPPQQSEPKNFVKLRAQLEQEWVEVRAIRDAYKSVAQQVPMSSDDIYQLAQRGAVNDGLTAVVREVEAHHGIGGEA